MTQFRSGVARLSVLALTAAVAAGCDTVGPDGTGNVQVTMQKIASATATQALADGFASAADGSYASIDADNDVKSLVVTVTEIQFLPAIDDAAWKSMPLNPAVPLDLMALPESDTSPLVIAAGPLDDGDYRMVRLLVSGGKIVFKNEISLGQAFTFTADEPEYDVIIPSGVIKTDTEFAVDGPTDVNLFFDPDATFQNATATGSGKVILTPVLRN